MASRKPEIPAKRATRPGATVKVAASKARHVGGSKKARTTTRTEKGALAVLPTDGPAWLRDYESQRYPTPTVSPAKMLSHLIDARQTSQAQVARATGIPRSTISAVLAGRRALSTSAISKLRDHFRVSADVFIA